MPGAATGFRSDERRGKSTTEDVENVRVGFEVTERIRWSGSANTDAFKYLASIVEPQSVPKVTVPAPQEYYFFKRRSDSISKVYPDLSQFWDDMADAYKREVDALIACGCRHIQFDDVVNACICDPMHVARLKAEGTDTMGYLPVDLRGMSQPRARRPSSGCDHLNPYLPWQ